MPDLRQTLAKIDKPPFFHGLTLLLAAAALALNFTASWKVYRFEPLREAASRSLLASNASFFYDSGLTEPLPAAALKLAMAAGADPDTAVRAEGLAVFAALFFVTLFVLWRRYGEQTALMGALFLAANPYMGYYAMQGSGHMYALLFLLLFWHFFTVPAPGRRSALLAGVCGALACLSRLDSAWVLLVVAGFSWGLDKKNFSPKDAGLALGLALLLTLPYVVYQKVKYKDFFYAQELSLRRWANVDRYGYRPEVEVPKGPLGPAAFVFRNGPAGALKAAFDGLGRSFAYELPRTLYYRFLLVLVFLGAYAAFSLRRYGLLVLLAAGLLPALTFASIKQVPATGGIELRYYLFAVWTLCALAGLGFQETLAWFGKSVLNWAKGKAAEAGRHGGKN